MGDREWGVGCRVLGGCLVCEGGDRGEIRYRYEIQPHGAVDFHHASQIHCFTCTRWVWIGW